MARYIRYHALEYTQPSDTLHTPVRHSTAVLPAASHVCIGCQKALYILEHGCILQHGITYIFLHPTFITTATAAQDTGPSACKAPPPPTNPMPPGTVTHFPPPTAPPPGSKVPPGAGGGRGDVGGGKRVVVVGVVASTPRPAAAGGAEKSSKACRVS